MVHSCRYCDGKFGLIRYYWWRTQFCSKKCRENYLAKLAQDRERLKRWLSFLHPS